MRSSIVQQANLVILKKELMSSYQLPRVNRGLQSITTLFLFSIFALLTACQTVFIGPYEKEAVDRITETSKQGLKFYEDLLLLDSAEKRKVALTTGELKTRPSDLELMMRLHLIKERGRQKNGDSEEIADKTLTSWINFSRENLKNQELLSNSGLESQRNTMTNHFVSALRAEDIKKLVTPK